MSGPDGARAVAVRLPRRSAPLVVTALGLALGLGACGMLGTTNRDQAPVVLTPEASSPTGDMSSPTGSTTTPPSPAPPTAGLPATTVVQHDLLVRTQSRTRTATATATVTSVPPPVTLTATRTSTSVSVRPPVTRTVTRTTTKKA